MLESIRVEGESSRNIAEEFCLRETFDKQSAAEYPP